MEAARYAARRAFPSLSFAALANPSPFRAILHRNSPVIGLLRIGAKMGKRMTYQAGDYIAVHRSPIWRDRSNFLVRAYLGAKEGKNEWEQLWVQKIGARRFILCCIPFFARDVDLGDEIETDADFVVRQVIQRSGQVTFRVWFGSQDSATRQELARELEAMAPLMEWSSDNLLALSASDKVEAQRLADCLHAREVEGVLQYETGRTE